LGGQRSGGAAGGEGGNNIEDGEDGGVLAGDGRFHGCG
jgi:hypothetical protein